MNYFENHLPKGEKIIAKTRKSIFIFARELLVAAILVAIILCVQFLAQIDQKIMYVVYAVAALIFIIFLFNNIIKYASTLMVVTTHKFMYKEDIVTIKIFDTQLANIDGIEVEYKTPLRRALNVGNIKINTRSTEHIFRNISKPDKFTAILNKQAADICDRRANRVRVSFGIAQPKQQSFQQQGETVQGEPKPIIEN